MRNQKLAEWCTICLASLTVRGGTEGWRQGGDEREERNKGE